MKNYHERRGAMSKIELQTMGASGGIVTGSCHRLDIKNSSVLIDYGLFQGRKDERSERGERRNFTPTRDSAKNVSQILITHPHIDHTGRSPTVFRDGFTPTVLATEVTATFMEPLLINSAEIQNQKGNDHLYSEWDVNKMLRHLKIIEPFKEVSIGQDHSKITAEFLPNGHVMGSNAILIRNRENGNKQNILFTGDMGKPSQSLCGGYLDQVENYPGDMINTLVIESTNFLGEPISFKEKENNLLNEINRVWMNKGTPLLAVLSFHRLQEIFEILHNNQGGRIPKDCGFIVDAPLGMKLLENFKTLRPDQLSNDYGDEKNYYKTNEESLARFDLNNMLVIDDHETSNLMSRLMATYRGKRIIIAGGGMLEHGRVLNYVHGDFCKNPNNEIITTCHQVEGTRGASLEHNKNIPVGNKEGARIKKIEGFTSHISGKKETFDYIERYNLSKLGTIIIVHGKDPARVAMANEFRNQGYDAKIIIPKLNQRIEI